MIIGPPKVGFSIYDFPSLMRDLRIPKLSVLCRKRIMKCIGSPKDEFRLGKAILCA